MKHITLLFGLVAICGGASLSGRIIGSRDSGVDDAYAVTVYSADEDGIFPAQSRLSTGAAISEYVIVVTAQAIHRFRQWRVGINSHDRNDQLILEVEDAFIHPNFTENSLLFDVGVLTVITPIEYYLPLATADPIFEVLFAIGFGYKDEDESILPHISQQTALMTIELDICRAAFNQLVIRETNFCGLSIGNLSGGDQGGVVVDFLRNRVYGIVSFWNNDAGNRNPVLFTNLVHPDIRSFLETHIDENSSS